jgi:hypothetical protein
MKYVAFYNGKKMTVEADTKYKAQLMAAAKFGAKKSYQVAIELANDDGTVDMKNASVMFS